MKNYPHDGQLLPAAQKKFEPTIVFVHFFGGSKLSMRRHVEFVNALGFDAFTFNLSFDKKFWVKRLPISRTHKFGLRYIWGDEIEDILRTVAGKKILFAFSNPAAATVDAIVRTNSKDIVSLVTDSGPFVQMAKCSWNLLHHQYNVKLFPFGIPATAGLAALWGITHSKDLHADLLKLPKDFPLLSIRGWEDPLVPVSAIDEAYAPAKNHLNYETLALPKGGHLNGLKDFPDEYKARVSSFLQKVSQRR